MPGPKLSYARAVTASARGLRVGLLRRSYEREVPAAPEVLRMMARTTAVLRDMGCRIEEAALPPVQEYEAVSRVILAAEVYAMHEPTLRSRLPDYSRLFRVSVLGGGLIRAADYIAAQRRRTDLIAATAAALQRVDALVAPAAPDSAPLLTEPRPAGGGLATSLGAVAAVAGTPSLVVPRGPHRLRPAARPRNHGRGLERRDCAAARPPIRARGEAGGCAAGVLISVRRAALPGSGREQWPEHVHDAGNQDLHADAKQDEGEKACDDTSAGRAERPHRGKSAKLNMNRRIAAMAAAAALMPAKNQMRPAPGAG